MFDFNDEKKSYKYCLFILNIVVKNAVFILFLNITK